MRNNDHNPAFFAQERETKQQMEKWDNIEENIFRQKSRVQWLQLGDSNTVFFFANMKNRISQNRIKSLINANGILIQGQDEINAEITNYYKGLLGAVADQFPSINPLVMREGKTLERHHQLLLITPITRNEVSRALKDIDDLKAPGCDGYNAYFFKKAWPVIGDEVTNAALEFFSSGYLYQPINCTTITLIPKVQNLSRVSDFRPISCCTILYKLISKILTQRLQQVMDMLVDRY